MVDLQTTPSCDFKIDMIEVEAVLLPKTVRRTEGKACHYNPACQQKSFGGIFGVGRNLGTSRGEHSLNPAQIVQYLGQYRLRNNTMGIFQLD
jgi:hypothetical protein